MTTITHTADGPRFDGMTVKSLTNDLHQIALRFADRGFSAASYTTMEAASAALRYLSEWRPIETQIVPGQAPWDGKEYHLYGVNPDGEEFQAIGHWWSEDEDWHQEDIGHEIPDVSLWTPTYYRPLPPSPDGGGA